MSLAGSIGYVAAPLLALFQTRHKSRLTPPASAPSSPRLCSAEDELDLEKAPLSPLSFPSSSSLRWRLRSLCRCVPYRLHDWDSTPEFLRTAYILSSYRVLFPFPLALRSFLLLHNETVNVWTHTAGAAYVLYLMHETYGLALPAASASPADYLLLAVFHVSALLCFSCSALYHWFGCMSVGAHSCLYIGDMSAIGLLILGSCQRQTAGRQTAATPPSRVVQAAHSRWLLSLPVRHTRAVLRLLLSSAVPAGQLSRCCSTALPLPLLPPALTVLYVRPAVSCTSLPSSAWSACTSLCTSSGSATRIASGRPSSPPPPPRQSPSHMSRPALPGSTRTGCACCCLCRWSCSLSCPACTSR